jgi:alanyl-tRNA synthetase
VLALVRDGEQVERVSAGESVQLVVDSSPFYAEGGGQIGDRGQITGDGVAVAVTDTTKDADGHHLHHAVVHTGELAVGAALELAVDAERRAATAANHSATHLLNAALRQVLGEHVRQAGSVVEPERLRFDFTHPKAMTPQQVREVERLVNSWILGDHVRRTEEMSQRDAKGSGATFLGNEDYGDRVRVVAFGEVSKELCGGTHVPHTSFIGSMRVRSEQSVASGVRRINAVTRFGALELAESDHDTLATVAETLRTSPRDVVSAAQRLAQTASRKGEPKPVAAELTDVVEAIGAGGVRTLVARLEADAKVARTTALELSKQGDRVVLLWSEADGRSRVVVVVPAGVELSAADAVKAVLAGVSGTGGGSETVAQGAGASFAHGPSPAELLATFLG